MLTPVQDDFESGAGAQWAQLPGSQFAVANNGGQRRRGCEIGVPEIVMDYLVVPLLLSGQSVDCDDAVGIQVVAEAFAAVGVVRRRSGRGKDDTLFALIEGFVKFENKGQKGKFISVYAEGATELEPKA